VPEPPTGQQVVLRLGAQYAVVVEVGGALRSYDVGDWSVVEGFPASRMADGGRGMPMLPWPNRLGDGRYQFDGQTMQLSIDEIERHNAIHGLTRSMNWTVEEQWEDRATLGLKLHPRPGYPFSLQLSLEYTLQADGLLVRLTARNTGERPLPFGAGQHPYFSVGTPTLDTALLRLGAAARLDLEPVRRLPTGQVTGTEGTEYDFAELRPIGDLVLDECYTDLRRDAAGRCHFTLAHPDGARRIVVWADRSYKYVQVFSGDTLRSEHRRRGLALEPMTCPPDAFRTGTDLLVLQPDQSATMDWGITPTLTNS
jgi:aldose 1-epimerase